MAYVAVKGGREAIASAADYLHYFQTQGDSDPLEVDQIQDQLYLAVDRVMGEGSLYAPDLAALSLKQSAGDTLEAAFMVRAYRTTQPRIDYSLPADTARMRVIRRISAAFKDIPGGQILGPTSDYTLRLLDFALLGESSADRNARHGADHGSPAGQRSGAGCPAEGHRYSAAREPAGGAHTHQAAGRPQPDDVTRQSITLPASRSAALQTMAMGETGGLLALAYSNMRGYGNVHPTVGELRVGYMPIEIENRWSGKTETIGHDQSHRSRGDQQFGKRRSGAKIYPGLWIVLRAQRDQGDLHGGAGPGHAIQRARLGVRGSGVCALCIRTASSPWGSATISSCPTMSPFSRPSTGCANLRRNMNADQWIRSTSEHPFAPYNFAFIDEGAKREIRRKILKAVAIPGYQVPFGSRDMPIARGWGTGGLQITLSIIGPKDVLKVIDQGCRRQCQRRQYQAICRASHRRCPDRGDPGGHHHSDTPPGA
jgi:alpha-D-ribose 1-methylphosphonate 5-triphosphate synthase subunit PhnI